MKGPFAPLVHKKTIRATRKADIQKRNGFSPFLSAFARLYRNRVFYENVARTSASSRSAA